MQMLNQYLGCSEVLSAQRYALGSLPYNRTKVERIVEMIASEIFETQRAWTEEPRWPPKRWLRGPRPCSLSRRSGARAFLVGTHGQEDPAGDAKSSSPTGD
jgi:hypothetical protein